MEYKNKELKKHSAAIQISNTISAQQRKCFNSLLFIAKNFLRFDPNQIEFEVDLHVVKKLAGVKATDNMKIKNSLSQLVATTVEYNILGKDKKVKWGKFSLLSDVSIENGVIQFSFPPTIHKTILRPEIFASLNLSILHELSSKYAIALYELLYDYRKIRVLTISIEDFRKLMGIDNKYPKISMLRKRVIEPAIRELQQTDLAVEYKLLKYKQKITTIKFQIELRETFGIPQQNILPGADTSKFQNICIFLLSKRPFSYPQEEAESEANSLFAALKPNSWLELAKAIDRISYLSFQPDFSQRPKNPLGLLKKSGIQKGKCAIRVNGTYRESWLPREVEKPKVKPKKENLFDWSKVTEEQISQAADKLDQFMKTQYQKHGLESLAVKAALEAILEEES